MNTKPDSRSFDLAMAGAQPVPPSDICTHAMLISVSISTWTARKFDAGVSEKATKAEGAERTAGRFNKHLLPREALRELHTIASRVRGLIHKRTLPWLDNGQRIISVAGYEAFAAEFRPLRDEWEAAKARFVAGYPDFLAGEPARLGAMHNEADYPTPDKVARKFHMTQPAVLPIPRGDDFRVTIPGVDIGAMRAEIEARVADQLRQSQADAFKRVEEVLAAIVAKLPAFSTREVVKDDGKKGTITEGIFRDSLVLNVRELAGLLPSLNVTGDAMLSDVTARLAALAAVEPDALREDEALRKSTVAASEAILSDMSDYLA